MAIFPVTSSTGTFGIFIIMQFVALISIIPSLRKIKPVEVGFIDWKERHTVIN